MPKIEQQDQSSNILDFYDKNRTRLKKLEKEIFEKTGNKVKFLSDRPFDEIEAMLPLYIGSFKSSLMIPKQNQIVNAKIIGKLNDWMILDAGFKDNIYVELKGQELEIITNLKLQTNDKVDVLITFVDEDNFEIRGSLASLVKLKINKELVAALENETSFFNAYIKEWSAAGYFVELNVNGTVASAFMPNTLAGINKLPDPKTLIGQTIEVMIENQTKDGFIVSRKKYLQSLIKEKLQHIEAGKIYTGNVTGTTDFGIFVEFETCLTGMIHKANVNPELVPNINKIEPGTEIEFYIKEIVKDKLILTQILRQTLWDTLKIGDKLNGRVKTIKNFGALISLDEETNGLIHNSELEKQEKKIQEGQEIKVKVISVQRGERKIFLSFDN